MTFFLHVFPTLCKTKFTDTFINFMTNAQIFAVVVKNFTLVTHRAGREEMWRHIINVVNPPSWNFEAAVLIFNSAVADNDEVSKNIAFYL